MIFYDANIVVQQSHDLLGWQRQGHFIVMQTSSCNKAMIFCDANFKVQSISVEIFQRGVTSNHMLR